MHRRQPTAATEDDGGVRPFFYSIADLPAASISQMLDQTDSSEEDKQAMYDIFGRDLMTKVILQSPNLSVFHEEAKPGNRSSPTGMARTRSPTSCGAPCTTATG